MPDIPQVGDTPPSDALAPPRNRRKRAPAHWRTMKLRPSSFESASSTDQGGRKRPSGKAQRSCCRSMMLSTIFKSLRCAFPCGAATPRLRERGTARGQLFVDNPHLTLIVAPFAAPKPLPSSPTRSAAGMRNPRVVRARSSIKPDGPAHRILPGRRSRARRRRAGRGPGGGAAPPRQVRGDLPAAGGTSSSANVSALIMPRSATMHTRPISKRRRSRSTTGITVVTSAVLPGNPRNDPALRSLAGAPGRPRDGSRRSADRRVRLRSCGESTWRLRMLVRTQSLD
jgi:hypothetical protein